MDNGQDLPRGIDWTCWCRFSAKIASSGAINPWFACWSHAVASLCSSACHSGCQLGFGSILAQFSPDLSENWKPTPLILNTTPMNTSAHRITTPNKCHGCKLGATGAPLGSPCMSIDSMHVACGCMGIGLRFDIVILGSPLRFEALGVQTCEHFWLGIALKFEPNELKIEQNGLKFQSWNTKIDQYWHFFPTCFLLK